MSDSTLNIVTIAIFMMGILLHQSCTHDPFVSEDVEPDPMDTTITPIDTMMVDTTVMNNPCDPDVVYFTRDILPVLRGSCALSGCHDPASATDGVVLDNYDNIIATGDIIAFDLSESKLYQVITEDDPDEVMPPTGKLDNERINLIATWILQGAENLDCDEVVDCDTLAMSFKDDVLTILDISCNGCHSTAVASGGVILDTYTGVKSQADNGKLIGAINWDQGFKAMPQGQDQLDACTISKIKAWINEGAQNN